MRIFVDQHAISRNSKREEQEPVFVIEADDGTQFKASTIHITGEAWLRYDKSRQPRAWIEAEEITCS